jgi:hypothetical protein
MITTEKIACLFTRNGARMAYINYTADIKLAAAHKAHKAEKRVKASIQLFRGLKDAEPYIDAVCRQTGIKREDWKVGTTWYDHDDDIFSIALHKKTREKYLWAIVSGVREVKYFLDEKEVEKSEISTLLTPSELKKFDGDGTTYNATNGVEHRVFPRTFKFESVIDLR